MKILSSVIFPKFGKLQSYNPRDTIKSNLGQKGAKFVYYIPAVIKRSNSITGFAEVSNSILRLVF